MAARIFAGVDTDGDEDDVLVVDSQRPRSIPCTQTKRMTRRICRWSQFSEGCPRTTAPWRGGGGNVRLFSFVSSQRREKENGWRKVGGGGVDGRED
jgi:hypothetical protein